MPDHVAIGQPGADEYLNRIGAALPEATLTVVDAAAGWLADTDTTVVFTDQPPANVADLERLAWVQLGSHGDAQLNGLRLPSGTVGHQRQRRPGPAHRRVGRHDAAGARPAVPRHVAAPRHRWDRSPSYQAELRGMRVGILGYGNIGREVTRLLQPLGMPVSVLTRSHNRDRGARYDPLDRSPDAVPEPNGWSPSAA